MAKFLIIDDDPACRRLLKLYLEPYGPCDLAHDGHEGLGAFRTALDAEAPYDLICLDIMMPEIDGHQVLSTIRKTENERGIFGTDGVKVIMITALMDSKHCIQAFEEGCESYVTKPVREFELVQQACSLLGRLPKTTEAAGPAPAEETAENTA